MMNYEAVVNDSPLTTMSSVAAMASPTSRPFSMLQGFMYETYNNTNDIHREAAYTINLPIKQHTDLHLRFLLTNIQGYFLKPSMMKYVQI